MPQCCYLCVRAGDSADIWTGTMSFVFDFKKPEVRIVIMELLWSYFLRDARRDAHYAAVHCLFPKRADIQLLTANKTHRAVGAIRTLHS